MANERRDEIAVCALYLASAGRLDEAVALYEVALLAEPWPGGATLGARCRTYNLDEAMPKLADDAGWWCHVDYGCSTCFWCCGASWGVDIPASRAAAFVSRARKERVSHVVQCTG
jgi:hypothetical protein